MRSFHTFNLLSRPTSDLMPFERSKANRVTVRIIQTSRAALRRKIQSNPQGTAARFAVITVGRETKCSKMILSLIMCNSVMLAQTELRSCNVNWLKLAHAPRRRVLLIHFDDDEGQLETLVKLSVTSTSPSLFLHHISLSCHSFTVNFVLLLFLL